MRIRRLSFIDHRTGWNIKDLKFDYLTLLVGASGVGKTKILRAILDIAKIAKGKSCNGVEWEITFEQSSTEYVWSGRFELTPEDDVNFFEKGENSYILLSENLKCGGKNIIERDKEKLLFQGRETVKLDATQSAIVLLKEEPIVKPVSAAFIQIYQLENANEGIRVSPSISKKREQIKDILSVHDSRFLLPVEKLFVLHKNGLQEFNEIKSIFKDIFPLVEDVDFTKERFFDGTVIPLLKIKEKGVSSWIMQDEISSGMFRTLSQITILVLAQDGDVILIDEFENGLGVNCIDRLANQIIEQEKDIQFIITSHHPYIINNIPFKRWKIVTRKTSDVTVLSAADLKIGEHSKHEAFMQLVQTKAFKTGQK